MAEYEPYSTMSIASFGPSTVNQNESAKIIALKTTNQVNDIDGAQSISKYSKYANKPPLLQSDVFGSISKPLTRERNVRDNSLYIDDIEGTRHTIKDRMMRTNRHVNPLNPDYCLPNAAKDYIPPTRFLKDPQNHNDIEGSHVKQKKLFATRDNMNVSDIDGAQTNWKRVTKDNDTVKSMLMVEDISARTRYVDKTQRRTDPCNPHYFINGVEYADDVGAKPKPAKKFIADGHLLMTKDITGASGGYEAHTIARKELRNTNFIGDIDGAKADSTKHSIVTNRQTNPLNPVYQSLDPEEYLLPLIPPLIPPEVVRMATIPTKVKNGYAPLHSARGNQPGNGSSQVGNFTLDLKAMQTGHSVISGRSGPQLSERQPSNRSSPFASARTSASATSAQRKMALERDLDISLVRQLAN